MKESYRRGIIISVFLIFLGILLEIITGGSGVSMPPWPVNIMLFIIFVGYILLLHFFWKSDIKNWLSSVPATVTVITAYSILVVLMGFIIQDDTKVPDWVRLTGLSHINRSWEFLFISIYLLTILGLVILRRLKKLNKLRNFAFFLNHFGIFLVITAAALASGDMEKLSMPLYVHQTSNIAFDKHNQMKILPFTVKLDSFYVEHFTPHLVIYNPRTNAILNEGGIDYTIAEGKIFKYKDFTFKIEKVIPNAYRLGRIFIKSDTGNTEYAALVKINNALEQWISSGNYHKPSLSFLISSNLAITLSLPEDKKYISFLDLTSPKCGKLKNVKLLVNKPIKYCGFDIYQQSYKKGTNPNFDISVLELVRDPWLPVIYFSLTLLLIGALLLFWLGKKID